MKTLTSFILHAVLLLCSSCRTLSYFESPNSLRNINGTLHLLNGTSIEGKLVVQTDNLLGRPVKVYAEGEKKPMQFNLSHIQGYTIRNEKYELKEIKENLSIGRQLFFMRRLTPEKGKMHLYEHMQKHTINKTATRYEPEHYIQLPGDENTFVYAANGSRFVPNFDEKMSRLLSDCPSLIQKIKERKDGYFYAQVSLLREKRVDVLMRIINEYNKCQ